MTCEEEFLPPGIIFDHACYANLQMKCDTWEDMFNESHPTLNCLIADYCPKNEPDCLVMEGHFHISVNNASELTANFSIVEASLIDGIAAAANISELDQVYVHLSNATDSPSHMDLNGRLLSTMGAVYAAEYRIQHMPEETLPRIFLQSSNETMHHCNMALSRAGSNLTVSSLKFLKPTYTTERDLQERLAEEARVQHEEEKEAEQAAREAEEEAQRAADEAKRDAEDARRESEDAERKELDKQSRPNETEHQDRPQN